MNKEKLSKMLILLFESKMKNYTGKTIDIWIQLLKNYDENKLEKVIYKLIYTKDDFISIGQIHELINPPINTEVHCQGAWSKYLEASRNGKRKTGDPLIDTFTVSPIKYGYLTDNFIKSGIKKDFMNFYKENLKIKNLQIGVNNG